MAVRGRRGPWAERRARLRTRRLRRLRRHRRASPRAGVGAASMPRAIAGGGRGRRRCAKRRRAFAVVLAARLRSGGSRPAAPPSSAWIAAARAPWIARAGRRTSLAPARPVAASAGRARGARRRRPRRRRASCRAGQPAARPACAVRAAASDRRRALGGAGRAAASRSPTRAAAARGRGLDAAAASGWRGRPSASPLALCWPTCRHSRAKQAERHRRDGGLCDRAERRPHRRRARDRTLAALRPADASLRRRTARRGGRRRARAAETLFQLDTRASLDKPGRGRAAARAGAIDRPARPLQFLPRRGSPTPRRPQVRGRARARRATASLVAGGERPNATRPSPGGRQRAVRRRHYSPH